MFFEDFSPGARFETAGRTITEADIVNFAGISGDWNEIHVNEEYAKTTRFGRRIAHGLLTLSVVSGLVTRLGLTTDSLIAFYGIDRLRFTKPVYIGDTVRAIVEVEGKEDKGDYGVVNFRITAVNQRGETVLVATFKTAVKKANI
ncbi:MAG: MaoC/PaaZ C-terminal domain-containing protein [Archaeoglobaceae archaeon]